MSILWLAGEVSREGTVSPGDQVIVKIARMSETQYSLTNQRAIENEEKWLVTLSHPNIIRLRPVAERHASRQTVYRARSELPGNPWFLVTDYLPGGDLQSLLTERRKLPASLALEIAEQLGDALTYLHTRNCVHCDIKPRNILFHERPVGYGLTEATRPIVIDFGIAKNPSEGPQPASGTPRWITPELYAALRVGRKLEVDPSWDVYAAGLVLYAMITGRKPELDNPGSNSWIPITAEDLVGDASVKQIKPLVEGLNRLIAGTTADLRGERSSAAHFTDGVRKLHQHVRKPGAAPAAAPQRQASSQRSSKGLWLALAGGALALLLAAALIFTGITGIGIGAGGDDDPPPVASPTTSGNEAVVAALPSDTPAVTATPQPTPTITPTRRPTSTPLNTPTHTATPRATATSTPRPPTATFTPTRLPSATPTVAAATATATPGAAAGGVTTLATSTALAVTSTPVPTPTRRQTAPSATPASGTAPPAPRPTTAAAAAMRVTLVEPANNVAGEGMVAFTWRPSRDLAPNECFEVVFWQGDENNGWAQGWGIKGASTETRVERRFDSATQNPTDAWLKYGQGYYWGVLLIENCDAYRSGDRQNSGRQRVSDVRRFVVGN